jgi:aspartate carbamoyltransferase catalytic subunit
MDEQHIIHHNIPWGFSSQIAEYDFAQFNNFLALSKEKLQRRCTDDNGRLKHIIKAEHFDLNFLETICETALAAKKIDKLRDNYLKGLLRSESVLNYFSQESSRTLNSFSTAEAHLGMRRHHLVDIKTSSTAKGESEKDSLRTQSSYYDAIVCRYKSDVYDSFAIWALGNSDREIPFINAGSGTREHPTQALLDYYTSWISFDGEMDNKVHIMAGDPGRSRTIKSRSMLYALHKNQTFIYVAEDEDQIDPETEAYVKNLGVEVIKTNDLKKHIKNADEVNMTRKQSKYAKKREKHLLNDKELYPDNLVFKAEYLDEMKRGSILTHPLPKRNEINPAVDYLKRHPKVMYWRALRNGMWTRVATLAYLFGKDEQIRDHYQRIKEAA